MAEITELWKKRCADHFRLQLRYWNLIGKNSGIMFVLYVMVVAGGFYYNRWLDGLPENFPGGLLITFIFLLFAVRAPIRTFIARADLVFLLPIEARLGGYFRRSRIYSFLMQSFLLFVVWVLCMPLFFQTVDARPGAYLIVMTVVLIVKWWNIDCRWREQSIDDLVPLKVLRTGLSFIFLYSILNQLPLAVPAACLAAMIFASFFLFRYQAEKGLLKWDRVLEMENRQAMHFLRFANLFTDVPRLKQQVKARRFIGRLFPVRAFDQEHVYDQLFVKTFLRANDYFGIYIRLTGIGMLVCFFIRNGYYTAFVVAAAVYLTGLQVLDLWRHPLPQALAGMYPISEAVRRRRFIRFLFVLLAGQSVLISLAGAAAAGSVTAFLLFLAAGLLVSGLFAFGYTGRRLAKENQ
ncbi:ABC transporter permease [Sporolactobacillus sp. THM7-7]|nr:ABC transporter permease [Sporolactobacillus sp. THM7-7]